MVKKIVSKDVMFGEDKDLSTRLLHERERNDDFSTKEMFNKLKLYGVMIGVCCGIFVQLSSLGANFLLVAIWGDDALKEKATIFSLGWKATTVFSLGWSFFTSCMALLILALLRGLINSVLDARFSATAAEARDHEDDDGLERETLMMTIEVRFVVGALTGVCLAWTCTDVLLGMQSLALYSLGTLVIALFWSKAMIWCFIPTNAVSEEEEEEDTENEFNERSDFVALV